jgi:adenylyl- and sulfurtransferase ThiI
MAPKKKEVELTKEDKEIIQETKILEKRENIPQKTGVVLTGGIDSTVTLCKVKRTGSMEIQPIVFEGDQDAINKILEKEGITNSIKSFENTNTKAGKKEVLQWCFENNVSPLTFGSNIEEYGINSTVEEMQEWRQISSEMNNYGVVIAEPLHPINKSVIIGWAKDYGILDLTAKPSESSKYKKIREEAFALAKIDDPHIELETEKIG